MNPLQEVFIKQTAHIQTRIKLQLLLQLVYHGDEA